MATTNNTVVVPAVPQLNVPPMGYDQGYQNQFNNVLRLYFQQLTNALGTLVGVGLTPSNPSYVIANNESDYAMPSYMQVARGLVPGASVVNIYGYQGSVGTTFIPVWENATAYTYPGSATTMLLYSSSASDTAVSVLITGLDSSYNIITETKVLTNGVTGVTTTNSYLRINSIQVTGSNNAVGTLYLSNAGKTVTYAQIAVGNGKSQANIYTVPNGYTFYLTRVNAYTNQVGNTSSSYCTYRVYTQNNSGIVTVLLQAPFGNQYTSYRVAPRAYSQKTDIQWQVNTPSSTAAVGIAVEGILISNTAV